MDRNAIMIHLRDIRDLELVKYLIQKKKKNIQEKYSDEVEELKQEYDYMASAHYQEYPQKKKLSMDNIESFLWTGLLGIITIVLIMVVFASKRRFISFTALIMGMVFGAAFLSFFFLSIVNLPNHEYRKLRKKISEYNKQEDIRVKNNQSRVEEIKKKWEETAAERDHLLNFYCEEEEKVDLLLHESYGINMIPEEYRNLAAIYYIYEYMSSSRATLEDTLFQEHLTDGIHHVLSRLDTIIDRNYEVIMQNRQSEAATSEMTDYYSKVNAYFILAAYLKDL